MLKLHKSDSACRICKHQFNHHCLYLHVEQGGIRQSFIQPIDIVPCDAYPSMDMNGKCGCLTWEPMDNLEYLELKDKQADEKLSLIHI